MCLTIKHILDLQRTKPDVHIVARREEQPVCDGSRVAYTNPNITLQYLRQDTAVDEPVLTKATL
jgi:hypothetical protein